MCPEERGEPRNATSDDPKRTTRERRQGAISCDRRQPKGQPVGDHAASPARLSYADRRSTRERRRKRWRPERTARDLEQRRTGRERRRYRRRQPSTSNGCKHPRRDRVSPRRHKGEFPASYKWTRAIVNTRSRLLNPRAFPFAKSYPLGIGQAPEDSPAASSSPTSSGVW